VSRTSDLCFDTALVSATLQEGQDKVGYRTCTEIDRIMVRYHSAFHLKTAITGSGDTEQAIFTTRGSKLDGAGCGAGLIKSAALEEDTPTTPHR
jgi:hypothetical protein